MELGGSGRYWECNREVDTLSGTKSSVGDEVWNWVVVGRYWECNREVDTLSGTKSSVGVEVWNWVVVGGIGNVIAR